MIRPTYSRTKSRSAYRSALGPGLGLLFAAPITFVMLSMTATLLAGCSALSLFLPAFLRDRSPAAARDDDCIVLGPDQYTRLADDHVRLPHF